MRPLPSALLLTVCVAGCGPLQVANPIVNQARTVAELQYQEVLSNIALLESRNLRPGPDPAAPAIRIKHRARLPGPPGEPAPFRHEQLCRQAGPLAGPQPPDAEALDPVRLALLEYAYEKAIGFRFDMPTEHRLAAFFEPQPRLYAALRSGWYGVGTLRDVPDAISYVGSFGDTYVWVFSSGVPSLAEFVRSLEFIVSAPPHKLPQPGP